MNTSHSISGRESLEQNDHVLIQKVFLANQVTQNTKIWTLSDLGEKYISKDESVIRTYSIYTYHH